MTESAATPSVDVTHYRAVLCRARQNLGGDSLLICVWLALQALASYVDGHRWSPFLWAAGALLLLALTIWTTISGNRTDDERATGPTQAFVAHCRSVLTTVSGRSGPTKFPLLTAMLALGGALLVAVAVADVVAEDRPHWFDAAAHFAFAAALALRPLWNRFVRSREFARELAALPPPPAPSSDLVGQIRALLAEGKKIQAIKLWRDETGESLVEAKQAVDRLEASD